MDLKRFIDGIEIIRRYYNKPDGHHISAEHDAFFLYPTDRLLSADDLAAVVALGWLQEGVDFDEAKDDLTAAYMPGEGWYCFT